MNPTPRLPVAAHAARVPAAIDATQLQRLRDNAWALPQVLAPADWSDAATAEAERSLDEAGFIQLQKGAGSRPSRRSSASPCA
jgi:ATP-dependent RNA helicase SUPV3L1/SUV3